MLIFLNIRSFFLVQTSFSLMLVENDCSLILCYHWKSLRGLTFQSIALHAYFLFYIELFWSKKIKYLFVSFKKYKYVSWTLLPSPGEKHHEYKEIFPDISFSILFCFPFIGIVFKRLPCVKWSFEACFWIKVAKKKKKNVNTSRKIIKWSAHTALQILHKKWLWTKDQVHVT